jgi:hypothetical protein
MSMHAVIRTYSGAGAKELFDLLEQRKADVEGIMKSVTGLVSYSLFRTQDGGISVSVCRDKAGTDESVKKAADWVSKNASNTGVGRPKVSEGTVVVQI